MNSNNALFLCLRTNKNKIDVKGQQQQQLSGFLFIFVTLNDCIYGSVSNG